MKAQATVIKPGYSVKIKCLKEGMVTNFRGGP